MGETEYSYRGVLLRSLLAKESNPEEIPQNLKVTVVTGGNSQKGIKIVVTLELPGSTF